MQFFILGMLLAFILVLKLNILGVNKSQTIRIKISTYWWLERRWIIKIYNDMKKMNEKEDDESCFGVLEENIFHPSHQGKYLPSKWKN